MPDQLEKFARSKPLRLALAAAMAGTALWAFAPYVANDVGREAHVNAPLIRIVSPVHGLIATDLPAPGTPVLRDTLVRLVTAREPESAVADDLQLRRAALQAALQLAERQAAELAQADSRLAQRSVAYGRAARARLASSATAAREDLAACEAEAAEAVLQRDRIEALASQRFATFTLRDQARARAVSTGRRCAALKDRAGALSIEAAAAGKGLYLAGSAMDASYAEQQRDRLMLRRQEVEAIASDARARLAVLDRQIGAELRRLQRAAVFDVVLPAGTAVWSQPVPRGSTVAPGATLIELVDCRRRYVEVALPERRMETLLPGERVGVRLVGGSNWQEGTVASALGGAARQEGAMTAASTGHDERSLTVDVSLPPPATLDRRCEVGRLAEVRFSRW